MDNKYFLITIDTEADNQWDSSHICSTINSKYLPRFQELAEKYNFKPTWLITYEMANDDYFVKYFKDKNNKNLCEIGMHLHAWNTPPDYELESKTNSRPYLIEYPLDIMEKKIATLDKIITERFNVKPISHRSGRWAMNDDYYNILSKYGYKIDCSVTPHINWKKNVGSTGVGGSDYSKSSEQVWNEKESLLEVPMTIRTIRYFDIKKIINIKRLIREIQYFVIGKNQWIRPDNSFSFKGIRKVIDICNKKNEYIMFMIHSSELMPGGSPNFISNDDIEKLYSMIECIFRYCKELGYKGITMRDYYEVVKNGKKQ